MRKIVVSEAVTVDGIFDAETMGQWSQPFASDERDKCIQENVEAADAYERAIALCGNRTERGCLQHRLDEMLKAQ